MTISFNVPSVEATKLKTSMESPVAAYNTITLSGEVKNPLAHTLKYRYIIYDGKNWKELQASDTLTTYDWKPDKAGNYILGFEVTDTNTNEVTNFLKVYSIQALDTKLGNMNCYTGDYKTYLFRQLVTSNDPGLTYKYQLYDQQTKVWSTMKDYINPDKVSWNPASSGDYLVNVTITGSDGSTYTNAIGVNVCGYKIASFGFNTNLQAGVPADLTLTGIDALNEGYTFKYYSYNLTTEKWDEIYSGNTPQAVSQTFAVSGYYAYKANVYRTSDGKIVDSTITYINPSNFLKNGWYYENGYKLYYKNGVLQTDLDGILPFQDSYYIEVNRSCCTVTIYAKDGDNGYIIPVHVFACSVGLPTSDMETPTGYFHTLAKYRWAELMGPSYGQYCTRIVGSILFHSVAGSNTTSYNLSAGEYNKLGSPASHGCVRLNVINAKWIYDHCALGTTVHIFDSAYPGPLGYGATIKIPATQNWDPTDPNVP